MRIPLFAHDANERVDSPICYKSHDAIVDMLKTKSIVLLRNNRGKEWAAKFIRIVGHTLQDQLEQILAHPTTPLDSLPELCESLSRSEESNSSITDKDALANVGIVSGGVLAVALVKRARNKIAAWPHVRDDRNVSVSGARWL